MSITKSEYILLKHVAQEAIWLRRFLNKLQNNKSIVNVILYGDNKASITLTKNAKR